MKTDNKHLQNELNCRQVVVNLVYTNNQLPVGSLTKTKQFILYYRQTLKLVCSCSHTVQF